MLTLLLGSCESIDHLCINPIRRIGLIHKLSIDYKSLITLETKHDATVTLAWQDSILHYCLKLQYYIDRYLPASMEKIQCGIV